jgi:hypothetical protein
VTARQVLDAATDEASFQAAVVELAILRKWLVHYNSDSRRATAGLPDLILLRPPRLVIAELKTEKGRLSPEQAAWLAGLAKCPGVEAFVWRPRDMDEIEGVLR